MSVVMFAPWLLVGVLAGVELAYITSPYREETVHFPVTIGRQ